MPTLVLWGALDAPDSARARAYARAFPRSQKIVFADAPHPCYLKAPSYFNRLLLQFAGASGSPPTIPPNATLQVRKTSPCRLRSWANFSPL